MRTVTPCIFKIGSGQIRPTYDSINFFEHQFILLANFSFHMANLYILPEFTPTPWMLQHHADKDPEGTDPWKIYAWCVRDLIAKYGNIEPLDERLCLQDRLNYCSLMSGQVDKAEINGQMFSYRGAIPEQNVIITQPSRILRKSTVTYDAD